MLSDQTNGDSPVLIWNAGVPHASLSRALFDEKIRGDPDVTDAMVITARDHRGDVAGFGVCVPRGTEPGVGTIKMIAVHPRLHRQGIGSTIMKGLVARLSESGCSKIRLGESPPNYLQPGVDADDDRANAFFRAMGFVSFGTAQDMTCPLPGLDLDTTADEQRLADAGIVVRRACAREQERERTPNAAAQEATVLAAIGEQWKAWLPEVQSALALSPPGLHIAETRDGAFAGFAAHSANNRSVGWFGPMGTHPDFQGLGIGGVLLRRCLRDLRDAGFESATIPWVAPVGFYERAVGARISRSYLRYEMTIAV